MKRTLLRLLLWPPALLAAILCGLFFLLQLEPVQNYAAHRAIEYLNRSLSGSLDLGRARFSLTGQIYTTDLVIHDDTGEEVLAAQTITAWLAPWDLVLGRVHVLRADLDGVRVRYAQDSSNSNLERAFAPRRPSPKSNSVAETWIRLDRTALSFDTISVTLDSAISYSLSDADVKLAALLTDTTLTYEIDLHSRDLIRLKSDGALWLKPDFRWAGHVAVDADSSVVLQYFPELPNPGNVSLEGNVKFAAAGVHADCFVSATEVGSGAFDIAVSNIGLMPEVRGEMFFDTLSLVPWIGDSIAHRLSGRAAFRKSASSDWVHDWSGELVLDSSMLNHIAIEAKLTCAYDGEDASSKGEVITEFGSAQLDVFARGLNTADMQIAGSGTIRRVQLHRFAPEVPDSLSPLTGGVDFSWRRNQRGEMSASIRANLSSLSLGRHELDSLSLNAELDGSYVRLHPTEARMGETSLVVSAEGSLEDSIRLVFDATAPQLAQFREIAEGFGVKLDTLEGALTLTGTATLLLNDSEFDDLRASGDITLNHVRYDEMRVNHAVLSISDFSLKDSTIALRVEADSLLMLEETVRGIRFSSEGMWQRSDFRLAASSRGDTLQAAASGSFDFTGSPSRIAIDSLAFAIFGSQWRNDFPFEFSLDSSSYEIDGLTMRSEIGVLRAAGFVSREGEQDLALEFSGFRTGQLTSVTGSEVPDGKLNLRLQFSGPATSIIGNLDATLDSVTFNQSLISDALTLSAEINGEGVLSATGQSVWFGDTSLMFSASVPATLSLVSGVTVADSLPLQGRLLVLEQSLSRLVPWIEQSTHLDGMCSADLTLRGTLREPDWNGEIHLRDGYYGDNRYGIGYKWIMFDAELLRDSLLVKQFRATSKGTLTGSGYAVLGVPWPERLDLTLNFDKFNAVDSRIQKAKLDGSLHIAGPFDSLDVSGELTALEGFYRITQSATKEIETINLDSTLAMLRGDTASQGFNADALYQSASHHLSILIPGNFWIRGAGVNIELNGELLLDKSHNLPPSADGQIAIRQGTVKFYGKELRVQENSSLTFVGPPTSPSMDISAAYKGADKSGSFEVIATVSGTPDLTQLSFAGTRGDGSVLSEAEAITYLLGLQDAGNLDAEEQAISAASGQISDIVGRASKLDVFEFRPGEGGLSDLSSGSLEVGTYITDRLFVRVLQPIETRQAGQTVSIDYRLLDWLKLSAQQASESTGDRTSSFVVYLQFEWR